MNKKIRVIINVFFIIMISWSGTISGLQIIFPDESEIEVCIDYDELLNYCNEFVVRDVNNNPLWLNGIFVITAILLISYWIPRLRKDIKELRFGYRSTWDDEFKR